MPPKGTFIYIIENILNNKLYVGVSNSPKRRFLEHKSAARNGAKIFHLQAAMMKYVDNIDNVFKMFIVEYFSSEQEALLQEIYWISYLKSLGLALYNETDGGEGAFGEKNYFYGKHFSGDKHPLFGTKRPQNVLDALSKAHKGKIIPDSLRKRWSDSHKGKLDGSKNHMFGKYGELNPNSKITDEKATIIYKMYHEDNILINDIVLNTKISKSTVERIVYSKDRFVWTKKLSKGLL